MYELDADLLPLATEMEGHPDNVAAALLGGFVLCAGGRAERFDVPAGLEAVLVVPHEPVRTAAARAALPERVPMADAVFNAAHTGLLVLGLVRGDWELVARGLDDRLHQPRREPLYPRSMELVRARAVARRPGGDHLGRGADRARLVRLRGDGPGRGEAGGALRGLGGCPARRVRGARGGRGRALGRAAVSRPSSGASFRRHPVSPVRAEDLAGELEVVLPEVGPVTRGSSGRTPPTPRRRSRRGSRSRTPCRRSAP